MGVNQAGIERIIRVIIGLFVLSLIFWGPRTLWGLFGFIPLLTGFTGWCPLYSLLHTSTNKKNKPAQV
jgi:hypothetical protein